jgi:hypothetical protein
MGTPERKSGVTEQFLPLAAEVEEVAVAVVERAPQQTGDPAARVERRFPQFPRAGRGQAAGGARGVRVAEHRRLAGVAYWPGEGTHPARILVMVGQRLLALNATTGQTGCDIRH